MCKCLFETCIRTHSIFKSQFVWQQWSHYPLLTYSVAIGSNADGAVISGFYFKMNWYDEIHVLFFIAYVGQQLCRDVSPYLETLKKHFWGIVFSLGLCYNSHLIRLFTSIMRFQQFVSFRTEKLKERTRPATHLPYI